MENVRGTICKGNYASSGRERKGSVSFNVDEEVEGQCACSKMDDYNKRLQSFLYEDAHVRGNHEVTDTKSHIVRIVAPPVGGYFSV